MTDAEIVDAINHKLSLLTIELATIGADNALALNTLSRFAVDCNRLVAARSSS